MLFCFFFLDKGLRFPSQTVARAMSSSGGATPPYTTLAISRPTESITHVELHRPEKRNAMNSAFWRQESELHIYIFYTVSEAWQMLYIIPGCWNLSHSLYSVRKSILSIFLIYLGENKEKVHHTQHVFTSAGFSYLCWEYSVWGGGKHLYKFVFVFIHPATLVV